MTTYSENRKFRPATQASGSGTEQTTEAGRTGTYGTEVPAGIPVTESGFRSLIIPPNFLVEPRPAWTELLDYAESAPYLGGGNRWVREAGIWYGRLVALPVAFVARLVEWVCERPTRALIFNILLFAGLAIFF